MGGDLRLIKKDDKTILSSTLNYSNDQWNVGNDEKNDGKKEGH